jgi:hypothetical protein
MRLAERLGLSIYDGTIMASALLSGCATLYPEDLQDGQVIDGQLTIRNPFSDAEGSTPPVVPISETDGVGAAAARAAQRPAQRVLIETSKTAIIHGFAR